MKVSELILKLEQYPKDVEVWIDIEDLWKNDTQCRYQDIVADIETFPDINNGIKLKSRAEVRKKLKKEIEKELETMNIWKLMRMKLFCTTKDKEIN